MCPALAQRVHPRFDYVPRRIKVRFADFEMDNILPLTLQRSRLIQDLERGLCSQARHPARQLELMLDGLYHDCKTPYSGKPHIIRRTMYGNSVGGGRRRGNTDRADCRAIYWRPRCTLNGVHAAGAQKGAIPSAKPRRIWRFRRGTVKHQQQPMRSVLWAINFAVIKLGTGVRTETSRPRCEEELLRDAMLFVLRAQNAIDRIRRATTGLVIV